MVEKWPPKCSKTINGYVLLMGQGLLVMSTPGFEFGLYLKLLEVNQVESDPTRFSSKK